MQIDLSDKIILLTGAFGGIAESVVNTLIEAGAFLILTDILAPEEAERQIAARGHDQSRCTYRVMDVTDAAATAATINALFEIYPGINIGLGHAGGTPIELFRDSTTASFDKIFDFNFKGQVHFTRPILAQWTRRQTRGHLIYTSTWVSKVPWKGITAYVSAKAALDQFARTLALEYADDGIRFNMVSPGVVGTGSAQLIYDADPEYKRAVDRISPLGHLGTPQSIANGILFLCSHLADELDGATLPVDAGVSLTKLQD